MKKIQFPIAAIAGLILPVLVRSIWFYQGVFWRVNPVSTPDWSTYSIPQPPITPAAKEALQPATAFNGKIVLVDMAHGNRFSISELETLTDRLTQAGARTEVVSIDYYSYDTTTLSLKDRLKYATAYVCVTPTVAFSTSEILALREFVSNGGRLLMLTDPTRSSVMYDYYGYGPATVTADVIAANSLLTSFDMHFSDDFLYNMHTFEGNFQNVYLKGSGGTVITADVSSVVLYVAHSISTETGTLLLKADEDTISSRTNAGGGLAAAALDQSGNVLAIGDLTFLQPPYNLVANNPAFIQNIAAFLTGGTRKHQLTDFPFLFQQPVDILLSEDVDLTPSLYAPLHSLQMVLELVGVKAEVVDSARANSDQIFLTTYDSKGTEDLLQKFDITISSDIQNLLSFATPQKKLKIKGMGEVSMDNTGLILFLQTGKQTKIILVAQDADGLSGLLNNLGSPSSGSMYAPTGMDYCLMQGSIGLCETTSSSSDFPFSMYLDGLSGNYPDYPKPDSTPTPMPVG